MQSLPFSKPGRFYRGNIHGHCDASDGGPSALDVCHRYQRAGYDFVSVTDHFLADYGYPITDTRPFRSHDFTTIIGAELHSGRTELGELWHILAVGLPFDFAPPVADESAAQITARAVKAGAFIAAAHPHWYALSEADIVSLGNIHAIEVYNGLAIDGNDRADSWHITDTLLGKGHRYTACATDDYHGRPGYDDFARGWVQVKSESLDPDALLTALKGGDYYASTGPEIYNIEIVPNEKAIVHCSPASTILVTGRGSQSVHTHGPGMISAELNLEQFNSPYCRVTVRDAHGERAWSNPIWF